MRNTVLSWVIRPLNKWTLYIFARLVCTIFPKKHKRSSIRRTLYALERGQKRVPRRSRNAQEKKVSIVPIRTSLYSTLIIKSPSSRRISLLAFPRDSLANHFTFSLVSVPRAVLELRRKIIPTEINCSTRGEDANSRAAVGEGGNLYREPPRDTWLWQLSGRSLSRTRQHHPFPRLTPNLYRYDSHHWHLVSLSVRGIAQTFRHWLV